MKTIAYIEGGWAVDPEQISFDAEWFEHKERCSSNAEIAGEGKAKYPALLVFSVNSTVPLAYPISGGVTFESIVKGLNNCRNDIYTLPPSRHGGTEGGTISHEAHRA